MTTVARIYRAHHIKQRLRTPSTPPYVAAGNANKLYGCGDSSGAVIADAVTLGGVRITEAGFRKLSPEPIPDPASPGLNIPQVIATLWKLRITLTDKSGETWADLMRYLDEDRRVFLQLNLQPLNDCGNGNIGHAVALQAHRTITLPTGKRASRVLGDNPLCDGSKWYAPSRLRDAAERFGDETGVPGLGIRFAVSRVVPRMAVER